MNSTLPKGYEIREISGEDFTRLWNDHAPKIFDNNSQIFRAFDFLTEDEKAKSKSLQAF